MKKRLRAIKRTFTLSITTLVAISIATLTCSLVIVTTLTYKQQVSSEHIQELAAEKPELAAYIDSQKMASPHFVALTTMVKQEQQRKIVQTALVVSLPVIAVSIIIGKIIARKLLHPVEDSFATQERFIQDAAHELRNPLAAMSASLEAARINKRPTASDYGQLISKLDRQTNRLITINEDLLFLQKKAESFTGKTNIAELARTVLPSFTHKLQEKNITLSKTIPESVIVSIRPKDFEIILRNIVDNAIKYSPQESIVAIHIAAKDNKATVHVQDQGIGIPSDELAFVTKRFYRASNTGPASGSGLGLALVQKVLDSYGGQIEIESKKQHGTTVKVHLPLYTKN
jgi:signal transduction histidine kinase